MELDLQNIKKVFFVGIGGIGISAIARMFLKEGKEVIGSDISEGEVVRELREAGAIVKIGQGADLIPAGVDLIVYTLAIEKYDPELFAALKSGSVPIRSYPEMLHIVTEGKYTIAVSGTHGKTTTTAMIAHVLKNAGKDPTVIVGSLMVNEKSNFIAGKSEYFVVEACEYRRSFLNINPKILVITNIEADHLDYYKDIDDIKNAFREMAMKVPADGFVVCNLQEVHVKDVVAGISAKVIDYRDFYHSRELRIPGLHNQADAAAAAAAVSVLGVDAGLVDMHLSSFPGTWRRFEYKGELGTGTQVYDDYAHHPTEIMATLEGFREIYPRGQKKITVVFQPHLYSRTKLLLEEFAASFAQADHVMLLPIYAAREEDDGSVSSEILAEKIKERKVDAFAFKDFGEATESLRRRNLGPNDVLVTMGAGEAFQIGEALLQEGI
jgi:UDP-N-acetylmuramate--alanine ligase